MRKRSTYILAVFISVITALQVSAQTVDVDVNWNIEHAVNGVSDFGRERHITFHSGISDPDWNDEADKLSYLCEDLDAYFGRDNGSIMWKFRATPEDPERPNHADLDWMVGFSEWWDGEIDALVDLHKYESKMEEMIVGTQSHPLYPTLCWWDTGFTYTGWQPLAIEASAEYVVEYLDLTYRREGETGGEQMPKYWEVINEVDMHLMTGSFLITSWEKIWEYHNLVATGVKERLGDEAPLIGGMTWGLHDIWQVDTISRYPSNYLDVYLLPDSPEGAEFYAAAAYTEWPYTGQQWEQWDKIWEAFIDTCGTNMDFYSVHLYDWPTRGWNNMDWATLRAGGAVEATLDTLEWYDVHKSGQANRKPVVISEYGTVNGSIGDGQPIDWECIRSWNAMFMQFQDRPDYIVKSMPFTPIKATWGDATADGVFYRYAYTMMNEEPHGSGNWVWSDYIKWFEFWSEVDGTRVDTVSSEPDVQVQAYVDGDSAFLILNNLETSTFNVNLNEYGLGGSSADSVDVKHMYCENWEDYAGTSGYTVLDEYSLLTPPGSISLGPDESIVLKYNFSSPVTVGEIVNETKFYGDQLNTAAAKPFRVTTSSLTGYINDVTVPVGPAEAVLRITGKFLKNELIKTTVGNSIAINGHSLPYTGNWRGNEMHGNVHYWFGTMEVPVPTAYLQTSNTVTCSLNVEADFSAIALQVYDFSQTPGRSATAANIPVTGINISEAALSTPEQRQESVLAVVSPSNASDKRINWSSSNEAVATVDPATGLITAVAAGSATITASTEDGGFTDNVAVTVTAFVPFEVTGIRVNPSDKVILLDATAPLNATVIPANAGDLSVTWVSSDPSVVTVDASGVLTAMGEGSTIVTATTVDGGYTDTTTVTVPAPVAVTGVVLAPETGLIVSGETLQMSASIWPANAYDPSMTWESLAPSVATVDQNGLVTAVGIGSAEIQVTTTDGGFTASSTLTVFEIGSDGTSFTVEAEDFDRHDDIQTFTTGAVTYVNWVEANDWIEYDVTIPEDGIYKVVYEISTPNDNTTVTFSLDGAAVSALNVPNNGAWENFQPVQSSGYVMMTSGPHTIRLTAGNEAWQWNLDKFTMTKVAEGGDPVPADGVSVSPTTASVPEGATVQLSATVSPSDASNKSVTWTSLNPSVATVDGGGLVTGVTEGPAGIVVTTVDGGFSATNSLTVTPGLAVTGVAVVPPTSQVVLGATVQLTADVSPAAAQYKSVIWTSLDEKVASVDSSGLIAGESEGTAQIVVTTVDGGFMATNITTVLPLPPEGPVLDLSIEGGQIVVNVTNGTADAGFTVLANTNLVEGAGWQAIASNLTFDAAGEAILTNSMDDADQVFYKIEEESAPTEVTIEAEEYDSTGGTGSYVNADGTTVGANIYSVGSVGAINWMQLGDWVEFENIQLSPGLYQIEYFIGTPIDTPAVDLLIDGVTVAHDDVTTNGDWDTFVSNISSTQVAVTAGSHTIRVMANGTGEWQWNMDRFILIRVGDLP